jgi:hypothetical protein
MIGLFYTVVITAFASGVFLAVALTLIIARPWVACKTCAARCYYNSPEPGEYYRGSEASVLGGGI